MDSYHVGPHLLPDTTKGKRVELVYKQRLHKWLIINEIMLNPVPFQPDPNFHEVDAEIRSELLSFGVVFHEKVRFRTGGAASTTFSFYLRLIPCHSSLTPISDPNFLWFPRKLDNLVSFSTFFKVLNCLYYCGIQTSLFIL